MKNESVNQCAIFFAVFQVVPINILYHRSRPFESDIFNHGTFVESSTLGYFDYSTQRNDRKLNPSIVEEDNFRRAHALVENVVFRTDTAGEGVITLLFFVILEYVFSRRTRYYVLLKY